MRDRIRSWLEVHSTAVTIILAGLVIRLFVSVFIPPGFDEAYYGVYSFHPAMGYFDHPPMVALTAGLGPWLTGIYSPLTLRLGALILFLFTALILYFIARDLYGEKAAVWSLILLHLTPYFMFGMGAFVFPDNALGFFWLLFLFSLLKVFRTEDPRWFLLAGFAFGMSMMSKYHGVFLPAGLFILLVFFGDWRRYWRSAHLYLGLLVSILFFAPNLVWNLENGWVTMATQFGKGASGGLNFTAGKFVQAILVQAAYLLPWHMYVFIKASVDSARDRKDPGRWLLPFVFVPIIVFTAIGGTRQILPHWPMPGYLGAIILFGAWMVALAEKRRKRFAYTSGIIGGGLISFICLQSLTGIAPIGKRADLTLDGQGWKDALTHLEENDGVNPEEHFLFGHRWFTAGEMAFAGEDRYTVAALNPSAPHGFVYWVADRDLEGKDGIFITTERFDHDPVGAYGEYFDSVTLIDTIRTYRASGKEAQLFLAWRCEGYRGEFEFDYGR